MRVSKSLGKNLALALLGVWASLLGGTVQAGEPLRYAGATTLQRGFMPEASRVFQQATGISVRLSGGNTDPGLQALLAGQVDLAGAGRFLRPKEKAAGLVEHLVGWDALALVVHKSNPIDNLSRRQLRGIFSGRIRNWQEVGGHNQPILVVASPRGSGMRAMVNQQILQGEPLTPAAIVALLVADADQQVAQLPAAICALSLSMVGAPDTKILQVDGIAPAATAVTAGDYPLLKPLTLVTRAKPSPAVADFIAFALSPAGQTVMHQKFFPVAPPP